MKLPCPLIRDLLPLYHDNVCAPETAAAVEEHLADCAPCQQFYHDMEEKEKLVLTPLPEPPQAASLQKIKRRIRRKYIAVALCVLLLCGGIFTGTMVCLNVIPVDYSVKDLLDVQFTTEGLDGTSIDGSLRLTFTADSPQVGLNYKTMPLDEGQENTEWVLLMSRRSTLGEMLMAKLNLNRSWAEHNKPNLYYLVLDWWFYAANAAPYGIEPPEAERDTFISKVYYFEDYNLLNYLEVEVPPKERKRILEEHAVVIWERDSDPAFSSAAK